MTTGEKKVRKKKETFTVVTSHVTKANLGMVRFMSQLEEFSFLKKKEN